MSNQPPLTLGDISSELIIKILHCCDCPTILRFAATCKAYNELVAQSISLQLQIELEANGLELMKGSFKRDATYSVILEDLRQFRDAWLDLNFGEHFVRPLGKSNMLLWELREGFYIKAFSQLNGQIPDALQFIPLDPETPDPLPLMFEFRFSEFTADPGQGLVAIISRDPTEGETSYIHLCSSTTGLAHPLAHYPILAFELDFAPPPFSTGFAIEIMGHTVLAKVSYSQDNRYELLIWNWKSGALLHRIASQEGMCDFTFLDQRHLVVLAVTRSSLFQDSLALLVYAISDDISTHTTSPNRRLRAKDIPISEPVLRLEFPKIKELSKISETGFFLRSDPTPGRTIYTKSATFGCPYSITLSMTFSFSASSFSRDVSPFYRVFVDGRSLLDCVRTNTYDSTKVLPWSSWGTAATRWFIAPEPPDHWICWMSGSRYIRPLSDVPYYSIFDFSSRTVGRFQERYRELYPTTSDRLVENSDLPAGDLFHDLELLDQYLIYFLEDSPYDAEPILVTVGADSPSIIPTCDPGFEGPIISELPYHLVCKANNELNHEGWQINGDCIVGVASWGPPAEMITICKLKEPVCIK
ncbi:hypothetical protein OPQ81_010374 [Rhizoctonia solani]|nr:hypothetical protein OPQ81_010374 [Rhizoctonia solani]